MNRILRLLPILLTGLLSPGAAPAITLYATDTFCPCFDTIDTSDFTLYAVYRYSGLTNGDFIGGLCFDRHGTLYALTLGGNSDLYIMNRTSPEMTLIGRLGLPFVGGGGMAFDRTSGVLYAVNYRSFDGSDLLTIDPETGSATDVGTMGNDRHVFHGLAFDDAGQLYGMDGITNALWKIDKNDPGGSGTIQVGSGFGSDIDLSHGGGMTNDADNGVYYGIAGGKLFTIDLATGVGTVLHDFGAYPAFLSLAYRGEFATSVHAVGWGDIKSRYR